MTQFISVLILSRSCHGRLVSVFVLTWIVFCPGAMLNAHPTDGETPSFKGSMMLAVAENEAQVLELLNKDIYVTSGVWDMENAQIIPVCYTGRGLSGFFPCSLLTCLLV